MYYPVGMAKGLRCKVKKRLRNVKRGVVKRELRDPSSKLGKREVQKEAKNIEALSGFLQPGKPLRSAFRYDDADAVIAQHNFRQGPDFRSSAVPESGLAVWGASRPKKGSIFATMDVDASQPEDPKVHRLLQPLGAPSGVPIFASKRTKQRLKNKSGTDHNMAYRWT